MPFGTPPSSCGNRPLAAIVERVDTSVPLSMLHSLVEAVDPGATQAREKAMVWVIAGRDGQGLREAIEDVRALDPLLACVVITSEPTFDMASWCLRMGVSDVIAWPCHKRELATRLQAAGEKTSRERTRASSRHRTSETIKTLTHKLREAEGSPKAAQPHQAHHAHHPNHHGPSADQVAQIKLATEFETLLRQELEVEPLLRTSLEFVIRKLGAMNAAIFLPAGSGDFTLGAFVNYDCPRESAQAMLDDLCHAIVPAFERVEGQHVVAKGEAHEALSRLPSSVIGDATFAVHSLHHEGECIAMFTVFRDHRQGWETGVLQNLRIIADLFGQQLARAAHTNQRHLSKHASQDLPDDASHDQWDDDDDHGMAA